MLERLPGGHFLDPELIQPMSIAALPLSPSVEGFTWGVQILDVHNGNVSAFVIPCKDEAEANKTRDEWAKKIQKASTGFQSLKKEHHVQ